VDRQEEPDGEILGSLYFEAIGIRISVRFAGEHWSWVRRITHVNIARSLGYQAPGDIDTFYAMNLPLLLNPYSGFFWMLLLAG
jgi:hypothetical protein